MNVRWTDSVALQPAKSARTNHSKRPGATDAVCDVSDVVRTSVGAPPAGAGQSSYEMALSAALQLKVTVAFDVVASAAGALNSGRPRVAQSAASRSVSDSRGDSCDAQPSNSVSTNQR